MYAYRYSNRYHIRPNPIASFTATTVCVGDTTELISTSISDSIYSNIAGTINSWQWNFGDGNGYGDDLDIIQHAYTSDGPYLVTLIVTDQYGCDTEVSDSVYVTPGPIANFTSDTVCEGDSTTFTTYLNLHLL